MKIKFIMLKIFANIFRFMYKIDRKKIIFSNFEGKGYGGNPKYILQELLKRHLDYDYVWIVDDVEEVNDFPKEVRLVQKDTYSELYEKLTSKVWIDNVRHRHPILKRKEQIYIQTWHAPFALKKVEKDAIQHLSRKYILNAKYDGKITNAFLADSALQRKQIEKSFWLNEEADILEFGLPRNDFIIKNKENESKKKEIYSKLSLVEDDFHILYAPTFRDNNSTVAYNLDFQMILKQFERKYQKRCKVLVRMHPNIVDKINNICFNNDIIDVSLYPDIQELSLISDCIISDYSSAVFDFLMLSKPVFLYASDMEAYNEERGLTSEYMKLPFPLATNNFEMREIIRDYDYNTYKMKIKQFYNKYPTYSFGTSSKQVVDWLIQVL